MSRIPNAPDGASSTRPLYCPRCGQAGPDDPSATLCDRCGDTLRGQSYCGICERFWCLPAGSPCPKHDLPLEEHTGGDRPASEGTSAIDWVTIAQYGSAADVQGPRLRLESEGIPTFIEGERMGSLSVYNVATGGPKLQVPRELAADARVLLDQTWEGSKAAGEADDEYDELAPEPGARRKAVMRVIIILVLLFPPAAVLFLMLLFRLMGL